MMNNLKLGWKLLFLAILTPVSVVLIASLVLVQTNQLKYEYDNLYGFMLIPIMSLDQANLGVRELDIQHLKLENSASTERLAIENNIHSSEEAVSAVLSQYETDWVTTLSPEFTQELNDRGLSALQENERSYLDRFQTAFESYSQESKKYLSGQSASLTVLHTELSVMAQSIDDLVKLNRKFADLSNDKAQAVIARMRLIVAAAGFMISMLALVFAVIITRSINQPVTFMGRLARNLAVGDLNRGMEAHTRQIYTRRRDEIGALGKDLAATEVYLQDMAALAGRVAAGDLTISITSRSDRDELGEAFGRMVKSLRELVGRVSHSAVELESASGQLASSAYQSGQASSGIAATIQQVSAGVGQQSKQISRTAVSVERMSKAIDGVAKGSQEQAKAVASASAVTSKLTTAIHQISSSAQVQARQAADTVITTRNSAKTVEETVKGMESIRSRVGLSAGKVQEMGQRSSQIGQIVETIEDIASQTNLLALNAAIEAARAGEHGKGFAVVADEVRKLAEKSAGATKEITALIKGIQNTVTEAVQAMNESAGEVERGVNLAEQSRQALNTILNASEGGKRSGEDIAEAAEVMIVLANDLVTAMDSVSMVVEMNTSATDEMASESREVDQAFEHIANISEENSAAIEEVSASAEELNAQVEEVTASAQTLAEMAQSLQQMVGQFTLHAGDNPDEISDVERYRLENQLIVREMVYAG